MSVHPFPKSRPLSAPTDPYFVAVALPAPHLRPLSALDQMYAYWGSDRA